MEGPNSFYATGADLKLVCYSENEQPVYHDPKLNSCFPKGLAASSQTEFAPIGAEWYYTQSESYNPPQYNYLKHTCIKDSTIAGKRVKVIQKTKFKFGGVTVPMGYEYLYQHGDTISYWKSGEFHVLYNFSLSKGDSILLYSEMPNQCEAKTPYGWSSIDSVYSATINNHQLKAYYSNHMKGSIWGFDSFPIIEKIGSMQYLLPQNAFCGIMDGEPQIGVLRCYSDPEIGFYQFENIPCDKILSWPDGFTSLNKSSGFTVFPNPVSAELFVKSSGGFEEDYTLELFSVKGELVKTECLEGGNSLNRIDVSSLKSGVYVVRLISASGRYFEEMIIKE